MKRFLLMLAVASMVLAPAAAQAQGETPFEVRARLTCRNTVRWSVEVGEQATQYVGVTLDFTRTKSFPASTAGVYTGRFLRVNHTVSHTVVFRRFAEAKFQEQVTMTLAPRVCL